MNMFLFIKNNLAYVGDEDYSSESWERCLGTEEISKYVLYIYSTSLSKLTRKLFDII